MNVANRDKIQDKMDKIKITRKTSIRLAKCWYFIKFLHQLNKMQVLRMQLFISYKYKMLIFLWWDIFRFANILFLNELNFTIKFVCITNV